MQANPTMSATSITALNAPARQIRVPAGAAEQLAIDLAVGLDPVLFVRQYGIEPDPWQAGVLRSAAPRVLLKRLIRLEQARKLGPPRSLPYRTRSACPVGRHAGPVQKSGGLFSKMLQDDGGSVGPTDAPPGSLHAERVRCGQAGCRCARGALHGPYWYRRWREHGRQRRQYVRPADLRMTMAAIARWREAHPPAWTLRLMLAELRRLSKD